MADGLRISQLPDLGAVLDTDTFPMRRSGTGSVTGAALKDYVATDLTKLSPLGQVLSNSQFAGSGQGGTGYYGADAIRDYVNTGKVFYPYGAVGNGVAVDGPAIQTAINLAANAGGGTVILPAGRYKLLAPLTLRPNVRLQGMGGVSSTLVLAATGMAGVSSINAVETIAFMSIADLCFEQAADSCTGVLFRLCRFTQLENLTFQGVSTCIDIDRGLGHSVRGIRSLGTSTYPAGNSLFHSTVDTDYIHHVTVEDYALVNQGTGSPAIGILFRRAINSVLSKYLAYGTASIGVVVENDCQAVKIVNMILAGCAAGVLLQQGPGLAVKPTYTTISDCLIDQASAYGIRVDQGIYTNIHNVQFTPIPTTTSISAIDLRGAFDVIVSNCRAEGLTGANGAFLTCSGAASDVVRVTGCTVRNCAAGVFVQTPATNVVVEGNTFSLVNNPTAGTIGGLGNAFRNNLGLNPVSVTAGNIPASNVLTQNSAGADLQVFINGGTNVVVYLNGLLVTTGLSACNFVWKVGTTLKLTYSTAPTWTWAGL